MGRETSDDFLRVVIAVVDVGEDHCVFDQLPIHAKVNHQHKSIHFTSSGLAVLVEAADHR